MENISCSLEYHFQPIVDQALIIYIGNHFDGKIRSYIENCKDEHNYKLFTYTNPLNNFQTHIINIPDNTERYGDILIKISQVLYNKRIQSEAKVLIYYYNSEDMERLMTAINSILKKRTNVILNISDIPKLHKLKSKIVKPIPIKEKHTVINPSNQIQTVQRQTPSPPPMSIKEINHRLKLTKIQIDMLYDE